MCTLHLGGINGDVQSDLSTLKFKNGEQLEDFHSRIIRLQQEIILSGETLSNTRLISRYIEALSKSDKIKELIETNMAHLITFLDNNSKLSVYKGVNIHGNYSYLEMIGYPITLTTSGHIYHNFGPSYYIKIDTATIQPVIAGLRVQWNIICKSCGIIGHKAEACIISGPNFLPQSIKRKMNRLNNLHGDETTDPPRECNNQHQADNFKYRTSPPKTSPVVSAIMGIINQHVIGNGNFEVQPSEFPFEYNSDSIPYP